jgi:branched-chain amino acid transport system substrate-binding protein
MPSRVLVRSRAALLCASLAAVFLAGCGTSSGGNSAVTVSGSTLTVYAGQPPGGSGGQAAADTLDAEQLALSQAGGKAGRFAVKLIKLGGAEISDNARTAIQNKTTIGYLGELVPGTSQVSIEILNQQGVLVVSPADTADYLTQATPAVSGSPTKYYPSRSTYHQTFARVVPNTAVEAKAQVQEIRSEGVTKLYVASDEQPYGAAIAQEVTQNARQAGLSVVSGPSTEAAVKSSAADGMFYGASDDSPSAGKAAATVLDDVSAAAPTIRLFASSGLYDPSFVSRLSPATQERITLSSPGFLSKDLTPAGKQFVASFRSAYGHQPATQAIFGYEAMSALLAVIGSAGANGNNRADIVQDFRAIKNRQSVIGTYSIQGGDPSIAPFVFSHVHSGQLMPERFRQVQG